MHRSNGKCQAVAVVLVLSLAACGGTPPDNSKEQPIASAQARRGAIPSPPANDPDAQNSVLLAAAEPFENLTESAFINDTAKLDQLIAKARSSAKAASRFLPSNDAHDISGDVAKIASARSSDNRADLAIASVEAYRTLASNVAGKQKIPKQVSLLDYSGFRYQADLKAQPVRWSDASMAVDFADRQWRAISGSVTDASLSKAMIDALAGMRRASEQKDSRSAMSASTDELDLVDRLETFFDHA